MASDKRLDQVKLVNSAESVLVVNGDQVEKATLAGFANSMGSSVPLQQTSSQVNITGLYARTSDGKMVELTKASVANVVAGLYHKGEAEDLDDLKNTGVYIATTTTLNIPVKDFGVVHVIKSGIYTYQQFSSLNNRGYYTRAWNATAWTPWNRIDNFGYNTLEELSSGVAGQMGYRRVVGSLSANDVLTIPTWLGLLVVSSSSSGHSGVYIVSTSKVTKLIESSESFSSHFELTIGDTGIKIKNISGVYRKVEAISIGYSGSNV